LLPRLVEIGDQQLFQDRSPEPDLHELQQSWPAVWEGLHQFFETLPETELAGELSGNDCSIARWELLLHIVNHATLHRGQVMGMLRQFGKQPPGTDLFATTYCPGSSEVASIPQSRSKHRDNGCIKVGHRPRSDW
jgi:uncharacterized damage-inducible protein DinB